MSKAQTLPGGERLLELLRQHALDLLDARADMRFDPPPPEAQRDQLESVVLRLKRERHGYAPFRGR